MPTPSNVAVSALELVRVYVPLPQLPPSPPPFPPSFLQRPFLLVEYGKGIDEEKELEESGKGEDEGIITNADGAEITRSFKERGM